MASANVAQPRTSAERHGDEKLVIKEFQRQTDTVLAVVLRLSVPLVPLSPLNLQPIPRLEYAQPSNNRPP